MTIEPVSMQKKFGILREILFHTNNPKIFKQKNITSVSNIYFAKQIILTHFRPISIYGETR